MIQFPEDRTWKRLLREIRDGQCTPFLGAGASFPTLALASTIAAAWAKESRQPVVFQLHGHTIPESIVLTEGD
jgi:hypothetical protein